VSISTNFDELGFDELGFDELGFDELRLYRVDKNFLLIVGLF
jgi:hypothetical protein